MAQETVTVSATRLKELEELEASLPKFAALIAQAKENIKAEEKREAVRRMNAHKNSEYSLTHYYSNREEINQRRREAYRAKKAAAAAATSQPSSA